MLSTGSRLGPYEVAGSLGAGGMGDVYRARDTRLDRTVALKVVRGLGAAMPDLRQRFEREARAVSALNHPHICTLYDVGQHDGMDFLVIELMEGETLAARLARGALPLEQALRHAREIIEALDHAHRRGVIHRDLKPSNVMLTSGGVKLLDFGLAKLQPATAIAGRDLPSVATQPMWEGPVTQPGTVLGTLHYMAPEQLEGKEVDARADLFAFGALLYEMITGRRPFAGGSPASVIAAILGSEPPPISTSAVRVPPALDRLVEGCLAKDPADRWQDARDLRRALAAAATEMPRDAAPPQRSTRRRRWQTAIVGATLGAIAAAGATRWVLMRPAESVDHAVTHLTVPLPGNTPYYFGGGPSVAISPDGRTVVAVLGRPGGSWLYRRPLDQLDVTRIEETGGARGPFFSPDGQWIGFFANRRLKKIRLSGGGAETVCELSLFLGATWGIDGTMVFPDGAASGLFRVSAEGGVPQPLTTLRPGERSHRNPQFLPDGKAVLFTVTTTETASYDQARIEVVALETGTREILIEGARVARFVSPGHLVFARAGSLLAMAFDVQRRRVSGDATMVVPGVWTAASDVEAAISDAGVIAYLPADEVKDHTRRLVWIDRRGQVQPVREERRSYLWPRISPGGQHVATVLGGPNNAIWVHDLRRNTFTRVTSKGDVRSPVWMPDSRHLLYTDAGEHGDAVYSAAADGGSAAQSLFESRNPLDVESVSPDGAAAFLTEIPPKTRSDIVVLPLSSNGTPRAFLQTSAEESGARISPDGRWLAYTSNAAGLGRYEVYVDAFPGPGGRHPISTNGGRAVAWAASGRELFYRERNRMMVVDVRTDPAFSAGVPKPLFDLDESFHDAFDVSPDGQRFITVKETESGPPAQINVVLNWQEELKRRGPTR